MAAIVSSANFELHAIFSDHSFLNNDAVCYESSSSLVKHRSQKLLSSSRQRGVKTSFRISKWRENYIEFSLVITKFNSIQFNSLFQTHLRSIAHNYMSQHNRKMQRQHIDDSLCGLAYPLASVVEI